MLSLSYLNISVRGSGNRGHSFIHRPGYGTGTATGGYGPSRWGLGGPVVGAGGSTSISHPWPTGPWSSGWSSNTGSVNYPAYPPPALPPAQPWSSGNGIIFTHCLF